VPSFDTASVRRKDRTTPQGRKNVPAKFVITKARGGKFRFELLASNGKVLAQSMAHDTKRAAVSALRSVQKNAATDVVDDQSEPAKKATTAKTAVTKSAARKATTGKSAARKTAATKTAATKTAATKTAATKTAASSPAAKPTTAKTAASTSASRSSETGRKATPRSAGGKRVAATAATRR